MNAQRQEIKQSTKPSREPTGLCFFYITSKTSCFRNAASIAFSYLLYLTYPMQTTISLKKAAYWVDITNPQEKHLEWLKREFNIHQVIIDELRGPSARPRTEVYKDYIYFIYYFPDYDQKEETSRRAEIDFLVTKNHVITVHYEDIEALRDFSIKKDEDPLKLLYYIIQALLQFQERQLRHIREKVEAIGKELFKNKEKEVLRRISRLKRDISEYRIIVRHQRPILESLAEKVLPFAGTSADIPYMRDLVGDQLKIVHQLDDYRQAISDFEDTNNQIMNLKINDVMKTFTILSFLTFPFMLISALFAMDTPGIPLSNVEGGFWIVVGAMAVTMATLIRYFKKKGWF